MTWVWPWKASAEISRLTRENAEQKSALARQAKRLHELDGEEGLVQRLQKQLIEKEKKASPKKKARRK